MKSRDEVLRSFDKDVCICDTTLNDGEKAAGVVFSNVEKYRLAQLLDNAGVPQIEVGIPARGGDEMIAIRHMANMGLKASIMAASRATAQDVKYALDSGVDSVSLSIPTSDVMIEHLKQNRQWVLEQMTEAVTMAKDHGLYVSVKADDAARTDLMFFIEFAKKAKDAGANRICYYDSVGIEDPFKVYERIESLRKIVGIDVEIHARNDFGMANAITASAIKAGAKFATTTVMGLGERCGNAPLEQVVMTSEKLLSRHTGVNITKLKQLAEFVSIASDYPIDRYRPFLGANCFTYENGEHTSSISKHDVNDEPYDPEEVGLARKVVIGKRTGSKALIDQLHARGVEVKFEDAKAMLVMIRKASTVLHRALTPEEVEFIYKQYAGDCDVFDENVSFSEKKE